MVRLKEIPEKNVLIEISFQFLMVRLKEISAEVEKKLRNISIPYGSIKSDFNSVIAPYNSISIPYSSIKS